MTFALIVVAGYLLGSCPWGYWLVKLFRGEDIRRHGSGAIGASNVWRAYGRWFGLAVVALDILKGFAPAFVGVHVVSPLCGILAGAAAMAGHARPIFLRFEKGGKMVATAGGVVIAVAPWAVPVLAAIWLLTFALTRYASVASIVAAIALPITTALLGYPAPAIAFASLAALAIIWLHRGNLRRLRAGTENRFTIRRHSAALLLTMQERLAEVVQLGCHDLRTPLATIGGFAKTMVRAGALPEREARFVQMIDDAAEQMTALIAELSLAAALVAGRRPSEFGLADTLELAAAAVDERISADGRGETIETDAALVRGALAGLAGAAIRFGQVPAVAWRVEGRELTLTPIEEQAAAVVDGSSPRDLGALVGRLALESLGGELAVSEGTLRVRL